MSFSATRLTCFALISASESDVRRHLTDTSGVDVDRLDWPEAIGLKAEERYRRERRTGDQRISPTELVDFLDFREAYDLVLRNKDQMPTDVVNALRAVTGVLDGFSQVRNRVAHTRPMELDDFPVTIDFCRMLLSTGDTLWPEIAATLQRLESSPAYFLGLTVHLPMDLTPEIQHNLPAPDFDETGLLGRRAELDRVKRVVLGAYPVVSILGDGGLGKTSVALKVAYELLDDPRARFDAVVWVTAKAATLTTTEIKSMSGAIEDSLGLIKAAAEELGGVTAVDPVSELRDYLENFAVLLVLDNVETVNDSRLRDFLLDLPLGSKVIITSRIGLSIENPVKLNPLSQADTKKLLLTLAHRRNVEMLKRLDPRALDALVQKLNGHPLFVKWLVAGVEAGRRPAELAINSDLLLDFCMSNVYEQLDERAVRVLESLQAFPGARSQAELAHINQLSAEGVQEALLRLYATNFVALRQTPELDVESLYELSEFARLYLSRTRPVSTGRMASLKAREAELRAATRELSYRSKSKYDKEAITTRGPGDAPVARMLIQAVQELGRAHYDEALALCREAQVLAPTYSEPYRVQGHIHVARQDWYAALQGFDTAWELAPDSSATAFHFGRFLLGEGSNPDRALNILQAGARLDPSSSHILLAIAEAHAALGDAVPCLDTTRKVLAEVQASTSRRRVVRAALRVTAQSMEMAIGSGDIAQGLQTFEEFLDVGELVQARDVDSTSTDLLSSLQDLSANYVRETRTDDFYNRASDRLSARVNELTDRVTTSGHRRQVGLIKNVELDRGFGFIRSSDSRDLFFHRSDLVERSTWEALEKGSRVAFEQKAQDGKNPRAGSVRLIS